MRALTRKEVAIASGAYGYGTTYTSSSGTEEWVTDTYLINMYEYQGVTYYQYWDYGYAGEFAGAWVSQYSGQEGSIWDFWS